MFGCGWQRGSKDKSLLQAEMPDASECIRARKESQSTKVKVRNIKGTSFAHFSFGPQTGREPEAIGWPWLNTSANSKRAGPTVPPGNHRQRTDTFYQVTRSL